MGRPAVHGAAALCRSDFPARPHDAPVQGPRGGLGDDGRGGRVQSGQTADSQTAHLRLSEGASQLRDEQHSTGN